MTRPRGPAVLPEVLAALTRAVPARAAKRLDASPRAADEWTWVFGETVTVTAGEETVTLSAAGVLRAEDASCTCLLQPRCFHLLAVLSVLPLAEANAPDEPGSEAVTTKPPESASEPLSASELATAGDAARVGAEILADGLSRVSILRMGELLRVAHSSRREGLPRLESAALGVYESVRDLRDKSPDFRLSEASSRVAELLLVSYRLAAGDGSPTWRGIARREYHPVGSLRLSGIGCEPVVRRGYAGVVTYFTDGERVYSAQEVIPGDIDRAKDAYDAQLRFGETSLSHREAARGGLLFARAEVSADGRLGAGRGVVCVSSARDEALVERLFEDDAGAQLSRADRGERMGLVFLRGAVRGGAAGAWLDLGGVGVPLENPIDDIRFAYRENLEKLSQAGARVKLVGRIAEPGGPVHPVALLAEGAPEPKWHSVGYDRLGRRDLGAAQEPAAPSTGASVRADALEPMRRRMQRFVLAGGPSLPGAALPEVMRECARLREALFSTGADGLEALALSAGDRGARARAWLAVHVYLRSATGALSRARIAR